MTQQQGLHQQLEIAQAQIQQLSQQLVAERETAQRIQSQLQKQLEQQQQRLANLETKEITYRQQFECNPQPMGGYDLETESEQAQLDLAKLNQELEQKVIDRTAALAASESRLNLLINANPATIYSCEPHGSYACTFVSKNLETLLDYTPEEVCTEPELWTQILHPDDAARVFKEIEDLFKNGTLKHEYRLRILAIASNQKSP